MQCRSEGTQVTDQEAAAIVDTYYETYPEVKSYLDRCKERVKDPGFVSNPFGRLYRFKPTTNNEYLAQMQRQGCNAPIQGTVADSMNISLYNLREARYKYVNTPFDILLQVHDEVIVTTAVEHVRPVLDIIRECMVDNNPIVIPTASGDKVYRFGVESTIYHHWGEPLTDELCMLYYGKTKAELGI